MRLPWLLPSILGALLWSTAAAAANLQSWQFDANRNRLEFTTDEGVQPRAQLIANPTRLVIDLPGVTLGRSTVTQTVGNVVRSVRVGQFDAGTTRIVIELAPGYTLNPQQVQFRGNTPSQWSVQLPNPEFAGVTPDVSVPTAPTTPTNPPFTPRPLLGTASRGETAIQRLRVTPDGFFIATTGRSPEVQVTRSSPTQIQVDFSGTTLSPNLIQRDQVINRFGVRRIQLTQLQSSPPIARVTLTVANNSSEWRAAVSRLGGVALIPAAGVAAVSDNPSPGRIPSRINPIPNSGQIATVQSVSLEGGETQLLIRADQPISYTSGWDRSSASYRITLNSARLAPQVKSPPLNPASPLLRIRLRQEDPRTVTILVQPAAGIRVGELSQVSSQLLSLQLQRAGVVIQPPDPGSVPIQVPPTLPPPQSNPPVTVPTVPQGRLVVVIDPGHGGGDPGAIGIGGLQEKGVVLDVSRQVAGLLQQQGITAVMTRQDDREIDLEPRVNLAERINARLFVSIHANAISLSRPDISGLETYYFSSGERLARVIHSNVLRGTGARDRGVRKARFFVLRKTSMPSVLVEIGFVTGAEDAARLNSANYRSQMAAAIAQGILQYIQQNR